MQKVVNYFTGNKKSLFWLIPVLFFVLIMLISSFSMPMWMDEYIFYKLSSNLPSYTSYANWLFIDRPSTINPMDVWEDRTSLPLDREQTLRWIYDNKVYPHSPLEPVLVYPFVKTLNVLADHNIIPHIEAQTGYPVVQHNMTKEQANTIYSVMQAEIMTKILRFIPIILFVIIAWLIFKILQPKYGNNAYLFTIPIMVCYQLLNGVYMFYWDIFMMFFFVLTLYLMQRNSKWAYLTACCLVNTKMFIGLLFLLPLIVKNWRMIFTSLSIVPFYCIIAYANGNLFFPFVHYITGAGGIAHSYVYHLYDLKGYIILLLSLGTPIYLLMTVPILFRFKKYPEYATLLIVGNLYAWGSGLGIAHLSSLVMVGALIFPIVAYEFDLINKATKIFNSMQQKLSA